MPRAELKGFERVEHGVTDSEYESDAESQAESTTKLRASARKLQQPSIKPVHVAGPDPCVVVPLMCLCLCLTASLALAFGVYDREQPVEAAASLLVLDTTVTEAPSSASRSESALGHNPFEQSPFGKNGELFEAATTLPVFAAAESRGPPLPPSHWQLELLNSPSPATASLPRSLMLPSPAPPPSPMAPPPPPTPPLPPPSPPYVSPVQRITERYLRSPYEVVWPANGTLPDAGLLVHCFDRHEDNERPWRPVIGGGVHGSSDVSASLIFAEQCRTHNYYRRRAPGDFLFDHGCQQGGVIFRMGVGCVSCGNAQDCDGFCDAGESWRPSQIASKLREETLTRAGADPYQARRNNPYNEFVVDGEAGWLDELPGVIEALLVGTKVGIVQVRDRFAEEYGLDPQSIPTLGHTCDCEEPFVLADLVPFDPCMGGRYRIVG